jgi:hypothetical protein
MHIIFGDDIAKQLRERHVVLQLETFEIKGKQETAYCVVQPESIALTDLPDIERLTRLHEAIIIAWNRKDYNTVTNGIEHVKGRFGGELDSFYETLENRIKESQDCLIQKST